MELKTVKALLNSQAIKGGMSLQEYFNWRASCDEWNTEMLYREEIEAEINETSAKCKEVQQCLDYFFKRKPSALKYTIYQRYKTLQEKEVNHHIYEEEAKADNDYQYTDPSIESLNDTNGSINAFNKCSFNPWSLADEDEDYTYLKKYSKRIKGAQRREHNNDDDESKEIEFKAKQFLIKENDNKVNKEEIEQEKLAHLHSELPVRKMNDKSLFYKDEDNETNKDMKTSRTLSNGENAKDKKTLKLTASNEIERTLHKDSSKDEDNDNIEFNNDYYCKNKVNSQQLFNNNRALQELNQNNSNQDNYQRYLHKAQSLEDKKKINNDLIEANQAKSKLTTELKNSNKFNPNSSKTDLNKYPNSNRENQKQIPPLLLNKLNNNNLETFTNAKSISNTYQKNEKTISDDNELESNQHEEIHKDGMSRYNNNSKLNTLYQKKDSKQRLNSNEMRVNQDRVYSSKDMGDFISSSDNFEKHKINSVNMINNTEQETVLINTELTYNNNQKSLDLINRNNSKEIKDDDKENDIVNQNKDNSKQNNNSIHLKHLQGSNISSKNSSNRYDNAMISNTENTEYVINNNAIYKLDNKNKELMKVDNEKQQEGKYNIKILDDISNCNTLNPETIQEEINISSKPKLLNKSTTVIKKEPIKEIQSDIQVDENSDDQVILKLLDKKDQYFTLKSESCQEKIKQDKAINKSDNALHFCNQFNDNNNNNNTSSIKKTSILQDNQLALIQLSKNNEFSPIDLKETDEKNKTHSAIISNHLQNCNNTKALRNTGELNDISKAMIIKEKDELITQHNSINPLTSNITESKTLNNNCNIKETLYIDENKFKIIQTEKQGIPLKESAHSSILEMNLNNKTTDEYLSNPSNQLKMFSNYESEINKMTVPPDQFEDENELLIKTKAKHDSFINNSSNVSLSQMNNSIINSGLVSKREYETITGQLNELKQENKETNEINLVNKEVNLLENYNQIKTPNEISSGFNDVIDSKTNVIKGKTIINPDQDQRISFINPETTFNNQNALENKNTQGYTIKNNNKELITQRVNIDKIKDNEEMQKNGEPNLVILNNQTDINKRNKEIKDALINNQDVLNTKENVDKTIQFGHKNQLNSQSDSVIKEIEFKDKAQSLIDFQQNKDLVVVNTKPVRTESIDEDKTVFISNSQSKDNNKVESSNENLLSQTNASQILNNQKTLCSILKENSDNTHQLNKCPEKLNNNDLLDNSKCHDTEFYNQEKLKSTKIQDQEQSLNTTKKEEINVTNFKIQNNDHLNQKELISSNDILNCKKHLIIKSKTQLENKQIDIIENFTHQENINSSFNQKKRKSTDKEINILKDAIPITKICAKKGNTVNKGVLKAKTNSLSKSQSNSNQNNEINEAKPIQLNASNSNAILNNKSEGFKRKESDINYLQDINHWNSMDKNLLKEHEKKFEVKSINDNTFNQCETIFKNQQKSVGRNIIQTNSMNNQHNTHLNKSLKLPINQKTDQLLNKELQKSSSKSMVNSTQNKTYLEQKDYLLFNSVQIKNDIMNLQEKEYPSLKTRLHTASSLKQPNILSSKSNDNLKFLSFFNDTHCKKQFYGDNEDDDNLYQIRTTHTLVNPKNLFEGQTLNKRLFTRQKSNQLPPSIYINTTSSEKIHKANTFKSRNYSNQSQFLNNRKRKQSDQFFTYHCDPSKDYFFHLYKTYAEFNEYIQIIKEKIYKISRIPLNKDVSTIIQERMKKENDENKGYLSNKALSSKIVTKLNFDEVKNPRLLNDDFTNIDICNFAERTSYLEYLHKQLELYTQKKEECKRLYNDNSLFNQAKNRIYNMIQRSQSGAISRNNINATTLEENYIE